MPLETPTFISDLVPTNPASGDPLGQSDDHLRAIKSALKATFPNVTGAVSASHTDLNTVPGLKTVVDGHTTSIAAVQGQANATDVTVGNVNTSMNAQLALRPTFSNFLQTLGYPNGYFTLPSNGTAGTYVVYGQTTVAANGQWQVFSFGTPFPHGVVFMVASPQDGLSAYLTYGPSSSSTFSAKAARLNSDTCLFNWLAIGY